MFFTAQTTLNDINKLPNLDPVPYRLESINISEENVKYCLHNLKINKASGPDLNSPRLLKEGAIVLARPFTIILGLDDMSLAWPAVVQLLVFIYSGIQ